MHFKGQIAFRKGGWATPPTSWSEPSCLGAAAHNFSDLTEFTACSAATTRRWWWAGEARRRGTYNAITHANLSVTHYSRGESAEAIAEGERALALDPNLANAHLGLAEARPDRRPVRARREETNGAIAWAGIENLIPRTDIPAWDGRALAGGRCS